jgi:hypothetical protein
MKTTRKIWLGNVAFAGLMLSASTLLAQVTSTTKAIEQDWRVELYSVSDPSRLTAPLFISSFSIPDVPALFQITWNHRDVPIMEEGGIQLQAYRWEALLDEREVLTPPWHEKLSSSSEVVTWTQRLHVSSLDYVFSVKNIVGTTWGSIPGPYTVKRSFLLWAPSFQTYSFAEIKKNSGIIMGTNRFKKLSITQTRFYNQEGQYTEDNVEKVLFSQPQTFEHYEFKQLNE